MFFTVTAQEEYYTNQEKQRNVFNKMDKKTLKEWIDNKKNANSEYLKLAREIYSAQNGGDYGVDDDTESKKLTKQKEELDRQLTELENKHKAELQLLKDAKIKERQTDEDFKIATAQSDRVYLNKRLSALEEYKKKVSNKNFIADIDKKIVDTKSEKQDLDPTVDNAFLASFAKRRDEELRLLEIAKNAQLRALEEMNISEQEYASKSQSIELSNAQLRLAVVKDYHKKVVESEIADGKLQADAVRESGDAIVKEETEFIKKRKEISSIGYEFS